MSDDIFNLDQIIQGGVGASASASASASAISAGVAGGAIDESSLLDGFTEVQKSTWGTIPLGNMVRYYTNTGEFRRGGIVVAIDSTHMRLVAKRGLYPFQWDVKYNTTSRVFTRDLRTNPFKPLTAKPVVPASSPAASPSSAPSSTAATTAPSPTAATTAPVSAVTRNVTMSAFVDLQNEVARMQQQIENLKKEVTYLRQQRK